MTVRTAQLDLLAHAEAARAVQVAALDSVVAVTGQGGAEGGAVYDRHAARPGFHAVGAWDGDRLVGFAYGMDPQAGSWWDGWVRPAVTAAGHDDLLGTSFEVVALHVDPSRHGQGLGRRLLGTLLATTSRPSAVLTTQGGANPARGFYAHLGWRELAATELDGVPYVVLATDLPAGRA